MQTSIRKSILALALAAWTIPATAQPHYNDAQDVISAFLADPSSVNVYDADGTLTDRIDWTATPGQTRTAISVCGTFMTMLLKHTYGFTDAQFKAKTGSTSPNAAKYHDAFVNQNGFTRITGVAQAATGDIIAIKYPAGGNTSGHVMMVQAIGAWQPRANSTQDFLANGAEPNVTGFYDVTVIDSSASYHGPADSRFSKPGGIGRNGVARIYVDASFAITGYTWSTYKNSEYKKQSSGYTVAIGRLLNSAW